MTIPEWAAIVALGVIIAIVGWGFRRMVSTQDGMAISMATMSLDIARLCGKIELAASTQLQHKGICDERHEENSEKLKQLHSDFSQLARKAG